MAIAQTSYRLHTKAEELEDLSNIAQDISDIAEMEVIPTFLSRPTRRVSQPSQSTAQSLQSQGRTNSSHRLSATSSI